MTTTYITNVRAAVRVDGKVQVLPASTRLPEGVAQSEIERLLRFGVIRVEELETVEEVLVEEEAPSVSTSTTARRTRTKTATATEE